MIYGHAFELLYVMKSDVLLLHIFMCFSHIALLRCVEIDMFSFCVFLFFSPFRLLRRVERDVS